MRAIWAQSLDRIIGDGSSMPWHIPEDLAYFKEQTLGAPVVMGRKSWEALPARFRPLPGRENIVLSSREPGTWSEGARVVTSLDGLPPDCWIIGGGAVYTATLPQVREVCRTLIDAHLASTLGPQAVTVPNLEGFDVVSDSGWLTSKNGTVTGVEGPARYRFQVLARPGLD